MRQTFPSLLAAPACAAPASVLAQTTDPAAHRVRAQASPAAATADMATGEVRKVDKSAAKLTLKHGEIKHLDMSPMTMVFNVRDKAVLDQFKAGDKVRFRAVNDAGKYTVTDIERADWRRHGSGAPLAPPARLPGRRTRSGFAWYLSPWRQSGPASHDSMSRVPCRLPAGCACGGRLAVSQVKAARGTGRRMIHVPPCSPPVGDRQMRGCVGTHRPLS